MTERLADYDGLCHVVINPVSTGSSDLAYRHLVELQYSLGNRYSPIFTEEKAAITQELIASKVEPGNIIVSAGGDGTDTLVVETLLKHPDINEETRRTPVISLYGGNANEGPKELTPKIGRFYAVPPHVIDIIKNGRLTDIHPLEVISEPAPQYVGESEENYQREERLALYFASLGLIGETTVELEKSRGSKLRNKPYLKKTFGGLVEAEAVRKGIKSARKSPISLNERIFTEDDSLTTEYGEVYDASFVNGRYMAKFGRFPSRLNEDPFFKSITTEGTWPKIFRAMMQMTQAKLPGVLIGGNTSIVLDFESIDPNVQLWGHIDGDPKKYPPKGTLSVRQYPRAYQAVTTQEAADLAT